MGKNWEKLPLWNWVKEEWLSKLKKDVERTKQKHLDEEYQEYLKFIGMSHVEKIKHLQQTQKPDEQQQGPYPR